MWRFTSLVHFTRFRNLVLRSITDIKINGEFKNNSPGFITDQPLYTSKSKKNNCVHYDNLEVLAPLQKKENAPEVRLFVAS